MLENALIVAGGYLIGSIPFGVVVVAAVPGRGHPHAGQRQRRRVERLADLRAVARGPVALLDVAKGFVPALVGLRVGGEWVGVLAGAAAMLGHARPIWLGFTKGGKMVATGGGVALALAPLAAGICLVVWLATFVLFRYASLASLVTAVALADPRASLLGEPWPTVRLRRSAGVACAVIVAAPRRTSAGSLARHRAALLAPAARSATDRREPVGERRLTGAGSPAGDLAAELADRAAALGEDVVVVDRLEVDLAREQRSRRRRAPVASSSSALERDAHGVLDEPRLEMGVLDDEELVGALEELEHRRAHRALDEIDERLGVDVAARCRRSSVPRPRWLWVAIGTSSRICSMSPAVEAGLGEPLGRPAARRGPGRRGRR